MKSNSFNKDQVWDRDISLESVIFMWQIASSADILLKVP